LRLVQGSRPKVLAASALVLMLATGLAACDRASDTDQQVADLEQQVTELETQLQLLDSSDPDDIELVNGDYQVIVKKGLATSIRKSKA
jgi:hypothetical protein